MIQTRNRDNTITPVLPYTWGWPFSMYVSGKDKERFISQYLQTWESQFGIVRNNKTLPKGVQKEFFSNILLCVSGTDDAIANVPNILDKFPYPEIIIILDPDFRVHHYEEWYWAEMQLLANISLAKGVFICGVDNTYDIDWSKQFITELSHNKNIVEALTATVTNGLFYYDNSVEENTRLSHVVDTIITGLDDIQKDNPVLNIDLKLNSGPKITSVELKDLLNKYAPNFRYDRELDEASEIKKITTELYSNYGIQRFSTIKQDRTIPDDYLKPHSDDNPRTFLPPQFSPPPAGAEPLEEMMPPDAADTEYEAEAEPPEDMPAHAKRMAQQQQYQQQQQQQQQQQYEEAAPEIKDEPRYLQAQIEDNETEENRKDHLDADTMYTLKVRIARANANWITAFRPVATDVIFEGTDSKQEIIDLVFKPKGSEEVQKARITLPRTGNSTTAGFAFTTGKDSGTFEGEIFAYHKGRMIQSTVIQAYVKQKGDDTAVPAIQMNVVFSARTQLGNLGDGSEFGISMHYSPDGTDKADLYSKTGNKKDINLNSSNGLEQLVKEIKELIEDAVINIDEYPEDIYDDNNVALMRKLAYKGNNLYVNFLMKQNPDGALQIVSNRKEFAPLDFVYTDNPPAKNAGFCSHAKEALQEGACKNCFDKSESPAPHICPFGFWSFSKIVERHTYDSTTTGPDFTIKAEPAAGRNTLNILHKINHASTTRIEGAQPGLRAEVAQAIADFTHVQPYTSNTWNEWTDNTKNYNPDSLILVVHTEKDEEADAMAVEIGNNDLLLQNFLDNTKIHPDAGMPAPLAIVIGCESNNIKATGFDISSQFINNGAAIVVSNFTKIRGRQAAKIVTRLVELLKEYSANETQFGAINLKLKQYLLSEGIMVGLALLTHGDADWKIKS